MGSLFVGYIEIGVYLYLDTEYEKRRECSKHHRKYYIFLTPLNIDF